LKQVFKKWMSNDRLQNDLLHVNVLLSVILIILY
jgi:hypothetical protein